MKKFLKKYSLILFVSLVMWGFVPMSVNAQDYESHCYPSEEQIQKYKNDGTWEKRQEYVKKLNHSTPSQALLYHAVQRNKGSVLYAAGDDIPDEWKGMQVTGNVKILLVRVEFADITFENSQIYSDEAFYNMVMGNGETGNFPYESLNAYYKRSSYDKLNITSDNVYSCKLSKNRAAYKWSDTGEQELIKEVFELLDAKVDFTNYDANHDGKLDGICINFAGDNTGWGSTWWSHQYKFLDNNIKFDGITPAGYVFLETYPTDDSYGTQTLIHEMGHMLGLPDYYSRTEDGIGTTDMMNNNSGDHNGFSKWLLGWIEEKNILSLNNMNGNTEVTLSPLAVGTPGDDKLIAVIASEDASIYSEYFIVQYDEYMGNQSVSDLKNPAYRVFHVDAELNDEGNNFKYDNIYAYDRHLIKAVSVVEDDYGTKRCYYREGDSLTPDTNEPSTFYGGDILGFTGMELTDFKTGDAPSFSVSFREKEAVDGALEFEITGDTPINLVELTLSSNKPLIDAGSYQQAYLEDRNGKQYLVDLSFEDGTRQMKMSYQDIANSLKPETEYTLVIPEGMFQIDKDVYSEECRIKIKTGVFPEIETADYTYGPNSLTEIVALNNEKAGFIQIFDDINENWTAELHIFEGTKEVDVIKFNIPTPEKYTQVMTLKGIACYDGTIALEIRSGDPTDYHSSISSFYKIDQSGNVLAGPFSMEEQLNIFPAGNGIKGILDSSGALGAPPLEDEYKLEVFTIDFENEPVSRLIDMQKYMSNVYAMDEDSYVVFQESEQGYKAGFYNNKDELITDMDVNANIKGGICASVKAGDNLVIMYGSYSENHEYVVSVSELNVEGDLLRTHEVITFQDWKSMDGWKMEKTSWGYSLYNSTSEQPYIICFLNEKLELISSMQTPNSSDNATHMGSRCIVKWYDITIMRYRVAITEPIAPENTEELPEPIVPENAGELPEPITPENAGERPEPIVPDNTEGLPESGESTADKAFMETGDKSNLLLLFFAMMISGVIIVSLLQRMRSMR